MKHRYCNIIDPCAILELGFVSWSSKSMHPVRWKHLSFQTTDTEALSPHFAPLRLDYERGRLSVTTVKSYARGRSDLICPPRCLFLVCIEATTQHSGWALLRSISR